MDIGWSKNRGSALMLWLKTIQKHKNGVKTDGFM